MLIRHDSDRAFIDQGGTFDESRGNKVINFIERYLVLESGKPFTVLPWMRDCIHSWYSWVRPDGRRRVKLGLLTCGRKQAKSMLTFGLTAYHLIADGEESPSCASCAVNREQAAQIYDWFAHAIERHPQLNKSLHCVASKKLITYPKKNGRYRSLASDQGGGNLGHGHSFVVYDEMAFFKNDNLWTMLKNSGDAKPNSFQLITSTAGWDKNGQFFKLVKDARKVLSGEVIDTTFQPWIFEIPEGADLDDSRNWILSLPSLGVTRQIEDVRAQWERDKRDGTSRLAATRLVWNQWTDGEAAWIDVDAWDACKQPLPNLDKRACVLGLDVGATRDLTAISLIFPLGEGRYALTTKGYVPAGYTSTRDNANAQRYQEFAKAGSLTITPGTATDEQFICRQVDELRKRYDVRAAVVDKWQSLAVSNHLQRVGVEVFGFPQRHTYFNAPCLELERLVNSGKLVHDGCPLMRWQVGHTYLDRDHKGYVKPITARPEAKKDNLIAALMALSQALSKATDLEVKSVYNTRGVLAF